jgi:hypothetical protein
MPTTPQEHLTRLSLARYLLRQAEQQLSAPAPARCVALSSLHDCLEMFLDTAAEAVGARLGNRKEFKDYWPRLAAASPPIHLPMERAMEKINRTREDLKHHGLRPADDQLKEYSIISRMFLEDACSLCCGISFPALNSSSAAFSNSRTSSFLTRSNRDALFLVSGPSN